MELTIWILFLFAYANGRAQPILSQNISRNSTLYPTRNPTSWRSPSRYFAFGFYQQGQGFSVGIWLSDGPPDKRVVWTAQRDDPTVSANATLVLTADGKLALTKKGGQTKSIAGELSGGLIYSSSMLDNGNFVLYSSDSKIIWQSFDHPTDTILPGQRVLPSIWLILESSVSRANHTTGGFRLILASGGLWIAPNGTPENDVGYYWRFSSDNVFNLNLDDNGHMYLVTLSNAIVSNLTDGWPSSNEIVVIYRATLDQDGIFRLYSHSIHNNGSSTVEVKWHAPDVKCSVNGICGFNSYCTFVVTKQIAHVFLVSIILTRLSDRYGGCEMRWGDKGFGSIEERKMTPRIIPLENTTFKNDSYSDVWKMEKEDCKEACLTDANCVAALFNDSSCSKLKLPLRYGRKNDGTISSVLFAKLSSQNFITKRNTCTTTFTICKTSIMILVIGAILTVCSGITMAAYGYLISRRGLWARVKSCEGKFGMTEDIVLRSFSYYELAVGTNGFNQVLGRGSFGTVYKWALSNNERIVAIKRLEKVVEEGEREFQMEMRAIGRTYHKNLVRLIGFCNEGFNRLLVYEFMSNGSLADLLFKDERRPPWSDRMRIVLEVARGILYLHEECEPHIIHCDIKPNNILMDEFLTAKISDFGLAKLLMPNQTRTFTGPRGTRGTAPEWYQNKQISVKADVYSFGIVLLKIVCCRRNLELEAVDDKIILSTTRSFLLIGFTNAMKRGSMLRYLIVKK